MMQHISAMIAIITITVFAADHYDRFVIEPD
jgi:hypothetical protein